MANHKSNLWAKNWKSECWTASRKSCRICRGCSFATFEKMTHVYLQLVALPFQTEGEVGCEALSSHSRPGFDSCNFLRWAIKLQAFDRNTWSMSREMLKPSDLPVGPTYFEKWRRVLRTIEFYAAARKMTLCIALPACTSCLDMKFSFSGTSLRQVKSVRAAQLLYHSSSYSQNLKLQISI